MQTKLTLRLDNKLIDQAKKVAKMRGKSLSKLVAEYFLNITKNEPETEQDLPPIVKSLYGSMAKTKIDEDDYKKHLEDKYF